MQEDKESTQIIHGIKEGLLKANNPNRKTAYDLVTVEYKETTVNLDSGLPNRFVQLLLQHNYFPEFKGIKLLKPEVTYLDSRFDFYWEREESLAASNPLPAAGFIEVKGVNYVADGIAQFPGAPTIRGVKHLRTLMEARQAGYGATVIFVIQRSDAQIFRPFEDMDPLFAATLREAAQHGVAVLTASMIVQGKCVYPTDVRPSIDLAPQN